MSAAWPLSESHRSTTEMSLVNKKKRTRQS